MSNDQSAILGNYELDYDETADVLDVVHTPTGDTVTFDQDGISGVSDLVTQSLHTEQGPNAQTVHPQNYSGGDLGEQLDNCLADVGRKNLHIDITGSHTLSTTPDLGNLENVYFDGQGAAITVKTAGQAGLDFYDYRDLEISISELRGDATDTPTSGILCSNPSGGGTVTEEEFNESKGERLWVHCTQTVGHFDYAPVFVHGRERNRITGDWQNNGPQGYAAVVSETGKVDIGGVLESESSPNGGALGTQSASKTWCPDVSFFSRENVGDGCLYLTTPKNHTVRSAEFRSVGEPIVRVDISDAGGNLLKLDDFKARVNTDVSADAAAPFMVVQDGGAGNQLSQVVLNMPDIQLTNGTASDQALIDVVDSASIEDLVVERPAPISGSTGIQHNGGQFSHLQVDWEGPPLGADGFSVRGAWELRNVTYAGNLGFAANAVLDGCGNVLLKNSGANVIASNNNGYEIRNVEIRHPSGSGSALRPGGTGVRVVNVVIPEANNDAIIPDGPDQEYLNVRVSGATGNAVNWASTDGVWSGGYVAGDVKFSGGANRNIMSGTIITGSVTFASNTDNNDLTGCKIQGSVTNNGGTGNAW